MIFKKLILKNIRSYTDFELEFPKGSVLLSGDVGAGKTSILLALQFALFGLQPGQKGASIMRNNEKESFVSLEFEVDKNIVIIERSLKRGKSISQEDCALIINGVREEMSTQEMKHKILDLLDYPKEFAKKSNLLYKFTVYTPQEEMKAIIQENVELRLDTLRHVFGIDRYKRIKENLDIILLKIKEAVKLKEFEIKEINNIREKLTNETERKIKISREINHLNIEHGKILERKIEAKLKLADFEKLLSESQRLEAEKMKKDAELRGKKEIKLRLEKEIEKKTKQVVEKYDFSPLKLQEVIALLNKHKNILETLNSRFLDINSKISVINSKKENLMQLKEKIIRLELCPTCYQSVSIDHKDKIDKRTKYDLEDLEREFSSLLPEKQQVLKDIEREKELILGYEKDKTELDRDKIRFEHQKDIETNIKSDFIVLERILMEIASLEKELSETSTRVEAFTNIRKDFEHAKKSYDEVDSKTRFIEINLAQMNKENEILCSNIDSLTREISAKEKVKDQLNYLRKLQDWLETKFSSLINVTESNVLAKLRSEFSKIFSEWFSILVPDSLSVKLNEDFTPVIYSHDYEIEYDFLSGGERTAVALAYRLSLNQILNSMLSKIKTKDIIILDEPTDGFSEQQLDKMRDLFDQISAEQVILVSHEQKIEGFVDSVIKIKKDGTSKVEKS